MEKKKYDLCLEVLQRLHGADVLQDLLVVGSWCLEFYKDYFSSVRYSPTIRTRDIDFLVPLPTRHRKTVDIPELLRDLGFIVGFKGDEGYIKLQHPDLIIEFLVPERGRGRDTPYPLPQFALNAEALRFLNILSENTIQHKVGEVVINLPHPAIVRCPPHQAVPQLRSGATRDRSHPRPSPRRGSSLSHHRTCLPGWQWPGKP